MISVAGKRGVWQSFSWIFVLGVLIALPAGPLSAAEEKEKEKPAAEEVTPTDLPAVKWLPKPLPVPDSDAKDEAGMKAYAETVPGSDAKFDMLPIRGGKFVMGSPDSEEERQADEGPQREVAIEPFWMGKCEVTWDEYEIFAFRLDKRRRPADEKPSEWDAVADAIAKPTAPYTDMSFNMGKDGRPAICMTQYAAMMYCKWLTAKTGRYYRLPTEAEWEYACRAGTKTAYSFGDDPEKLGQYAWYFDNSKEQYHKVGTKKPNPWGLHDMHGNVCEWVLDQYVADYYKTAANPAAAFAVPPDPLKIYPRVARGGSWDDDPEALRSAARRASNKEWSLQDPQIPQSIWWHTDAVFLGFRVLRPLRVPSEQEAKLYEPDPRIWREYREAQGGKE